MQGGGCRCWALICGGAEKDNTDWWSVSHAFRAQYMGGLYHISTQLAAKMYNEIEGTIVRGFGHRCMYCTRIDGLDVEHMLAGLA